MRCPMALVLAPLPFLLPSPSGVATADGPAAPRPLPAFDRVVLDDDFPGAYQVEVADIDGDGRPDVVALGGGTCAWYQNPSWQKRIITGPDRTPGIISSAAADLDRDGKAEVAIAYNFAMREPTRGSLGLATIGDSPDTPWSFEAVAEVPSIHRLRWADVDGDGRLDLVVAPIFGRTATPPAYQDGFAGLVVYRDFAAGDDRPGPELAYSGRVLHAIDVARLPGDDRDTIFNADNAGVALLRRHDEPIPEGQQPYKIRPLVPGADGDPPAIGSSEVHLGRLAGGRALLATVEPWHGSTVAVYSTEYVDIPTLGRVLDEFGPRTVLDDTLDQGHALWLADVNGDGTDEVFAGHRGDDHRVSAYHFDGKTWNRTVIDRDIATQDLRGGDLDGDGTPDIVAVGGTTGNVVWYRPTPQSPAR